MTNDRGSLARHTGNATSRLIEAVRPNKKRHRVRAPLDAAHLDAKRNGTGRRGKPWRLLRVVTQPTQRNGPGADCVPRPLVSELPAGGAWGASQASRGSCTRVLAAISFGLRRTLYLGLRIADRFGQHLVQLSLCLLRFARRFPLGHAQYVGMPEAELNPSASELNQNGSLTARIELWELARKADRQAEDHYRSRANLRRH